MLLKNGDRDVLQFSIEDCYLKVINNQFLPYELKDYVKTTDFSSPDKIKESLKYIEVLKDFLASRTLTLTRDNAKAILRSVGLPQSSRITERIRITLACNALNMTDNFWVTDEEDKRKFSDVCLRNNHLGDVAYQISILSKCISATLEEMEPDLMTDGMFPKTWHRSENGIELWKTDKSSGNINTVEEQKVSDLLEFTNVKHVKYKSFQKDGRLLVKCSYLASDRYSIINAFSLNDWCIHTGRELLHVLEKEFIVDFAKMCVIDYIIANTDRHLGNINFFVDNETNMVVGMTPLFDHNQALVADEIGADIDKLVYDATNLTMLETAKKYYSKSSLEIEIEKFPKECQQRWEQIIELQNMGYKR